MEAIQLTILALLANGLGVTANLNTSTTGSNSSTDPIASSSLHSASALTPATSSITSTPSTTSGPSSAHLSDTSTLSTTCISSPYTTTAAESTPISTPQSTSHVANQTTMTSLTTKLMIDTSTTIKSNTIKPTTKKQDEVSANMIIGSLVGGVLLLMVVIIVAILVWKTCSNKNSVQDVTWAGTCPVPNGEDLVHTAEDNDIDTAPAKRPSLTTFLSKKSKRESLLDQYKMEVQEPEGIINASSPNIEEKLIVPEVKMENEIGNEKQGVDFPPSPFESQGPLNDNDPHAPPPATDAEAPGPLQAVPDVDPNSTNIPPPPPLDFLDLVNDFDLPPPPLSELQV